MSYFLTKVSGTSNALRIQWLVEVIFGAIVVEAPSLIEKYQAALVMAFQRLR